MPHRMPAAVALLASLALAACGGAEPDQPPAADGGAAVTHVHGLGIDPADGALLVATHHGLLRAPEGSGRADRVGEVRDYMGFTVAGPGRYLASGHPSPTSDEPPALGLIASEDAGRTWETLALRGEADLHVMEAAGGRVYGVDSHSGRMIGARADGSDLTALRPPPGGVFDLAVDPEDPERVYATTEAGLAVSRDGARSWRSLGEAPPGLLEHDGRRLVLVTGTGEVRQGSTSGRRWRGVGAVGGPPAALLAAGDRLYAAVQDGPVVVSEDGGRSWSVRLEAPGA